MNYCDNDAFTTLGNIGFDFLTKKEYDIAQHIYLLLSKSKTLDMANKMMYLINYLNASKQLHEINPNDPQICELDVSMASDFFKVGKSCLQDDHELTYTLLNQLYPDTLCAHAISTWPLFINFRETEWFEQFKREHEGDFDEIVFENDTSLKLQDDC